MFFELLVALSSALFVILMVILIENYLKSRRTFLDFRRRLPDVPFMPEEDRDWFNNHIGAITLDRNSLRLGWRHKELGETYAIVGLKQFGVSTVDLDLIKQVCVDKASKNVNRFKIELGHSEYLEDCILTARDEQWRRIRRALGPAMKLQRFRENTTHNYEITLEKLIESIESKLATTGSHEFDLDNLMHRFVANMVLSCFYKQYNEIEFDLNKNDQYVEFIESMERTMFRDNWLFKRCLVPAINRLADWLEYNLMPNMRWRRDLKRFIVGIANEKRKAHLRDGHSSCMDAEQKTIETMTGSSIVDSFAGQYQLGRLTKSEFVNSSSFMFVAADKTLLDAIVHTLYQLAANELVQEKLRSSIQAEGEQSEYLSWVINESLRLLPPVMAGCTRETCEEIVLKKYNNNILPAGSFILTPLYTIHRLAKYWGPDADKFRPERFERAQGFHPCQFMPWGAGLRSCLGKEFALFLMKKLLCQLLERYKFTAETKKDLGDFDAPFLICLVHHSHFQVTISRLTQEHSSENGCEDRS